MRIGDLEITGHAALAPMAGVADRAMRELCRDYGAAYTVGELVSAKGVSMRDKKSASLLQVHDNERPMALQLFGAEPKVMADAAQYALGSRPDFLDINMGCPAPKVAGNGGGAALMKDPKLAGRITKAVVDAVPVPVTVKIRSGWDENTINAVEVALECEAAGAKAITVHGRTRAQMYAPPVSLDIIRQVKEAVQIPVIGNGNIASGKDAQEMYEKTGCDFIMVGRAATGAPWIFAEINAWLSHEQAYLPPPASQRMLTLIRQVRMMVEYKGEYIAMREARKHAAWYMRGLHGAADYRRICGTLSSMQQLEELAAKAAMENPEIRE